MELSWNGPRKRSRLPTSRAPHMFCPSSREVCFSLSLTNVLDSFSGRQKGEKKSFLSSFFKLDIFAHRGLDDVFCHTWILERCWVWLFLFPWMLAKRQKTDRQCIPMFGSDSCLKGLSRVLIGHFKPFTLLYFLGPKVKTVKRAKTSENNAMKGRYLKNGTIGWKHPHSKDNRTTNLNIPPRVVHHKNKQDNPHVVTEWQFSDNPTRRETRPQTISMSRQNWRGSVAQVWSAGLLGVISRWVADKTSSERPQTRHLDSLPPLAMCSHSGGSRLWTQDDRTVKRWAQSARGQVLVRLVNCEHKWATITTGEVAWDKVTEYFGEGWTEAKQEPFQRPNKELWEYLTDYYSNINPWICSLVFLMVFCMPLPVSPSSKNDYYVCNQNLAKWSL